MKIRIVNDGQKAYMTTITNAETGEALLDVKRVVIDYNVDQPVASAMLFVLDDLTPGQWRLKTITTLPQADIIAEVAETQRVCACCGGRVDEKGTTL